MYCGYNSMFSCNKFKSLTPELLKRIQLCMYNKKNKDEIIPVSQMNNDKSDIKSHVEIEQISQLKISLCDTNLETKKTNVEINENIYLIKEKLLRQISLETQTLGDVSNENGDTFSAFQIQKGEKEITMNNSVEHTTMNESKLDLSTNGENIISPTQKDTLFWCIFILHFSYNEYLQVNRNYGIKELEIKQTVIEYLNQNPGVLKQTNYKITKASIQEISSEFLTSQKDTSMLCFIAMISYFKMNIIMVDSTNRFMLEFISNKDENLPTYVLYKDSYGKYKVNIEPILTDTINNMKNTLISLENYMKPLKPASNYKIDELVGLAMKLGIYNENAKIKKNELYQQIYEICKWQ